MSRTIAYHRPTSIEEALDLLGSPGYDGARRVLLAGGTVVNATAGPAIEVVDLQALDIDGISDQAPPAEGDAHGAGTINIGAMARLQDIAENDSLPPALRDAARSELPSTLRTIATIGGTVGVHSGESVLLAALLAHEATVTTRFNDGNDPSDGNNTCSLASWLADDVSKASIITSVTIASGGRTAVASTGRTPADIPIVAAVGRRTSGTTFIALTGVADTPVIVDPADPTAGLSPSADFRGSVEYRLELARVLTARVLEELGR